MPAVMRNMNLISRCQGLYRAARLSEDTLKSCHHGFVLAICAHPGESQDFLAEHLCLNKSTVARSLGTLEASKLIRREVHAEDRRVTLVFPTEQMLSLYPRVREIARDWNRLITEDCTEEELTLFLSVLERMAKRARTVAKEGKETV